MSIQQIHARSEDTGRIHAQSAILAHRAGNVSFADLVRKKNGSLTFSAHAQSRLKSRNIEVTDEIMKKLDNAVCGAESKGAKDTLVLLSDLAFIVNVPNKTVITAMDGETIRENIFTNIDSTVIAR